MHILPSLLKKWQIFLETLSTNDLSTKIEINTNSIIITMIYFGTVSELRNSFVDPFLNNIEVEGPNLIQESKI
jgi:hypothetical protein